ncbi:unnamed protein product [Owenia fusiformis]|uniref:Uncharacterized protein n=1 Tax=Owenia fusiformis TaxID=6347 RepID=A0A8J1TWJ1_OWEFU|nr:unnamed protein product [Owenia fusiformis]
MGFKKDNTFKDIVSEFANDTATNGVPNIARAGSIPRRIIWTIIVLVAAGWMFTQLAQSFITYYKRPHSTLLTETFSSKIYFPAVTICNINPVRESQIYLSNSTEIEALLRPTSQKEGSERFSQLTELQRSMQTLPTSSLQAMGHLPETMIMSCTYAGEDCSYSDFTMFTNYKYGNCITYNAGPDIVTSSQAGAQHGLSLELFVEENEYLTLTDTVGFKVSIERQNKALFPEETGIFVPVGARTALSLKRQEIIRLPDPYSSDCWNLTANQSIYDNAYSDETEPSPKNYTRLACLKTCYQLNLITQCACLSHKIKTRGTAYDKANVNLEELDFCNLTDSCYLKVKDDYEDGSLDCNCNSECWELAYSATISQTSWPAPKYLDDLLRTYAAKNDVIRGLLESPSSRKKRDVGNGTETQNGNGTVNGNVTNNGNETVNENIGVEEAPIEIEPGTDRYFAKLDVYFDELNFIRIEETIAYTEWNLFSDLGGQFGFWLGFSIVSIFEIIEFLIDVSIFLVYKSLNREKLKAKVGDSATELEGRPVSSGPQVFVTHGGETKFGLDENVKAGVI